MRDVVPNQHARHLEYTLASQSDKANTLAHLDCSSLFEEQLSILACLDKKYIQVIKLSSEVRKKSHMPALKVTEAQLTAIVSKSVAKYGQLMALLGEFTKIEELSI